MKEGVLRVGGKTGLSHLRAEPWGRHWMGCSLSLRLPSPLPPTQIEAVEMMDQIVHWVREDPSGLGRPQLPGAPASEPMAVPMMLLNLVEQLGESDEELAGNYAELGDWCAQRILQHVQVGGRRPTPAARRDLGTGDQGNPHASGPWWSPSQTGRHREARSGRGMAWDPREGGGPR